MRNIRKRNDYLNENVDELPLFIDIESELSQLRDLDKEKISIPYNDTGDIQQDISDRIHSSEYNEIIDKKGDVEDVIKNKIRPIMLKYCERGDFDGAKWFVGKSFKDVSAAVKVLLFREILILQGTIQ